MGVMVRRLLVVFAALMSFALVPVGALAQAEGCSNETVRQEQGSVLPDCRAYEMVSPPAKNGADVMGVPDRTRASRDGNAVQFASLIGFGDVQGTGIATEYMGVRDGSPGTWGWSVHAITPLATEPLSSVDTVFGLEPRYMGEFSSDLSKGVFLSKTMLTSEDPNVAGVVNLFLRHDLRVRGPGSYSLLTACPGCSGPLTATPADQPAVAGASSDFSHVIFESTQDLTADAVGLDPNVVKLYEWANGVVRLAGILPDDECGGATPPCPAPTSQAAEGALENAFVAPHQPHFMPNTISQDGRRIFFTVESSTGSVTGGQLYMRVADATPDALTVHINAPEGVGPSLTPVPARYWMATPDGSQVFFSTKEKLIPEDTSDANLSQLYRYSVDAPPGQHLTLVSPDLQDGLGADIQGVLGASDDGSYVYFVSSQQIVSGEQSDYYYGIYVWHDGVVHSVTRIRPEEAEPITGSRGWLFQTKDSRVTPDGKRMIFATRGTPASPHVGLNDTCVDEGGNPNSPCKEIYLYDATANGGAGSLTCASCPNPVDGPAHSDATFYQRFGRGATGLTAHLSHPLSDDGRYVFFETGERLVSEDVDGTTSDVYEFDAQAGKARLISSGKGGSFGAYFLDASADGRDVFFITRDRLNGWDVDSQVDLYDARIGGGFPDPAGQPITCGADTCHGAPTNNPAFAPLSSIGFSGDGNLKPVLKNVAHRSLTRARKLKKALKKCKTKRKKSQRKKCELSAKKSFGRTK
jgi:Tol biopolymer transport system component